MHFYFSPPALSSVLWTSAAFACRGYCCERNVAERISLPRCAQRESPLQAELLELHAPPTGRAEGVVIEAT
eukprot:1008473-Pleurochrysis_carterae.AAC.1